MTNLIALISLLAVVSAHKIVQDFGKASVDRTPFIKQVECSVQHDKLRNDAIANSTCGDPRSTYVHLEPRTASEIVTPTYVWLNRCSGNCYYDFASSECMPADTVTRTIHVRIFNVKTSKESCATYLLEEHLSCGCCMTEYEKCGTSRRKSNRRKCCKCPNIKERRSCLQKKSHMKWNRRKCACEPRKRIK